MALNPIAPVTDYQSMLNRICWFTSAAALGAVCFLRSQLPELDQYLAQIDQRVQAGLGNMLPVPGSLIPALIVGMSTRIFRTHSHLGHWLGIRERFDIDVILTSLGRKAGIEVDYISEDQWLESRHELMRKAFYRYTSSQSPQIDIHLIHQALDLWSWFWIGIETAFIFVVASFVLIAANRLELGLITFLVTLLLTAIGLPLLRLQCKRAAVAQVRAIVADPARAKEVQEAFSLIGTSRFDTRRAA